MFRLVFVLFSCLSATTLPAQDSLLLGGDIQEVNVRGHKLNTYLLESPIGTSLVDLRMMDNMPRILGNADPMHYAQMLPGVQTNSEYDAGLHIQGCDNAHNMMMISGVPIYNAAHLLGFFSIFNTPHFATMQFTKSPSLPSYGNRLGGFVDMLMTDTLRDKASGDLSIGPISSQGTLRLPVGKRSLLTVSARQAYINLLYGRWLKLDTEVLRYSFGDYNVTWLYQPNDRHQLSIDFYHGYDNAKYSDEDYLLDTGLKWGNTMFALHLNSLLGRQTRLKQTAYVTHSYNDFKLDMNILSAQVPSRVTDVGYKAGLQQGPWSGGAELTLHTIKPQDPQLEGQLSIDHTKQDIQHSLEASLYGDYTLKVGKMSYSAGGRATFYQYGDYRRLAVDPAVSVKWNVGAVGEFTLRGSLKHQYMHRSGFSNMGLPTEFWFSASQDFPAQYAWNVTLGYETWLLNRMYHITLEGYHKWLYHQQEYNGNVLDVLYSAYDLHSMLLHGHGYNYGINLLVEKRKGRLTGWMAYSWGRALRRFYDGRFDGLYPANHERIHEFNSVLTYKIGRWSFGSTLVFASGTPFTASRSFYLINGSIISVFGEHNAQRLKPYFRLDLSVNYDFKSRNGRRSGINLSIYDVTMHNNDIYYRLKIYDNQFAARPFSFMLSIMPSINYYYHF
ncbi:MAG: TonB-dependent receptor [Prevotella sp.]|nr:TonB-dependent receptor [Prevotella sp.]